MQKVLRQSLMRFNICLCSQWTALQRTRIRSSQGCTPIILPCQCGQMRIQWMHLGRKQQQSHAFPSRLAITIITPDPSRMGAQRRVKQKMSWRTAVGVSLRPELVLSYGVWHERPMLMNKTWAVWAAGTCAVHLPFARLTKAKEEVKGGREVNTVCLQCGIWEQLPQGVTDSERRVWSNSVEH